MERPVGPLRAPDTGRRGRSRYLTETIECGPTPQRGNDDATRETAFEKARGINRVEIRGGFAQVHVQSLPDPVEASRLRVLDAVAEAGVSLDFLKLTASGMLFLIPGELAERTEAAIRPIAPRVNVYEGRSIVLVHAVNMRDEEGLIAQIVSAAIASGGKIDHLGDMHDRLLIAAPASDAEVIAGAIQSQFGEAGS